MLSKFSKRGKLVDLFMKKVNRSIRKVEIEFRDRFNNVYLPLSRLQCIRGLKFSIFFKTGHLNDPNGSF